jgi:isoleucyl-tRNA synthetase
MFIVEKYGADSLRYYFLSSSAVAAESLNFSEKGVDEVYKKVIMRLKNVLAFYKIYTNESSVISNQTSNNILDRWILARLNSLAYEITEGLDNYEIDKSARPIADFVDDLSTWYIRRSRERFKEESEDKNNAINTTRFVLVEFSKIIAPFMPFISENIYQELGGEKESVHLDEWPEISSQYSVASSQILLQDMNEARKIVALGLEARARAGIKVRQPIQKLKIKNEKLKIKENLLDLIKSEVNVKEIIFGADIENEIELDTTITDELKREGMIRELVRRIQDLRKRKGYVPRDKIKEIIFTDEKGKNLIKPYMKDIKKGTGAISIEFSENNGERIKIDELKFKIEIKK